MVHATLRLLVGDDALILEPVFMDPSIRSQTLSIERATGNLSIYRASSQLSTPITVFGLLGMINLNAGLHLFTITKAERIGKLNNNDVYRVLEAALIALAKNVKLGPIQEEDDRKYSSMLLEMVQTGQFYFSYTYDLTRHAQAQPKQSSDLPLCKRADERFYWNQYLQRDFILKSEQDSDLANFILPVIFGFVSIKSVRVKDREFDYVLITRRSRKRAGTRFNTRGIDIEGNVANFNETEQIVIFDNHSLVSFVQVRGSIPLFWRQVINIMYQPKMEVEDNPLNPETLQAVNAHLQELSSYGEQIVMVNLIDKKGYELAISNAFANLVKALNDARLYYTHFDFHKECKKMRFDRVSLLLDELQDKLAKMGYFRRDANGVIQNRQLAIIRTNCMDCLDRTNVVQALFARYFLRQQLIEERVIDQKERLEDQRDLELILRNVWADNADAVSSTYAGTGALKTDFTRTGKRTQQGAIQDLINSCIRYLKNNFLDGYRQDAFDLFLGNYRVQLGAPSPFAPYQTPEASVRFRLFPLILGLSIVMLLASLLVPTVFIMILLWTLLFIFTSTAEMANNSKLNLFSPENLTLRFFFLAFWGAVLFLTSRAIMQNGQDFLDQPRLVNNLNGRIKVKPALE